jgi:hypothetical protein
VVTPSRGATRTANSLATSNGRDVR